VSEMKGLAGVEDGLNQEDDKLQVDRRMLKREKGDIDGESEHPQKKKSLDEVKMEHVQDEGLAVSDIGSRTTSC
jgi:hypothetical protein